MPSYDQAHLEGRAASHKNFLESLAARITTLDEHEAPLISASLHFAFAVGYVCGSDDKLSQPKTVVGDPEGYYLNRLMGNRKLWRAMKRQRNGHVPGLVHMADGIRPGSSDPTGIATSIRESFNMGYIAGRTGKHPWLPQRTTRQPDDPERQVAEARRRAELAEVFWTIVSHICSPLDSEETGALDEAAYTYVRVAFTLGYSLGREDGGGSLEPIAGDTPSSIMSVYLDLWAEDTKLRKTIDRRWRQASKGENLRTVGDYVRQLEVQGSDALSNGIYTWVEFMFSGGYGRGYIDSQ